MGSEDSFPCLQELATGAYPEPNESSPQPHSYFCEIYFNISLSPIPGS